MLARLDHGLVTVIGPDARSYLQSLLSQDVDPFADGEGAHALLLQPQGKLLADLLVLRIDEQTWWCVCERSVAPVLAEGLNRFRIRVKVDVSDISAEVASYALRGDVPAWVPDAVHAHVERDGVRWIRTAWPGADVIGAPDAVQTAIAAFGTVVDDATFERARVEAGVPRQGFDIDDRTIPQEAFLERDAVSFTKGCFVGQELVCRIDTRGHVNRYLRRVRADGPVRRGDTVEADGKAVGEITTAAGDIALAMVRHEVEVPATVTVAGRAARVEAV